MIPEIEYYKLASKDLKKLREMIYEMEKTKSQNTKNEQQKDLCITSEQLTEQLKKGKLPSGEYYIIDALGLHTTDRYYPSHGFGAELPQSVLGRVPSYEELQNMNKAVNECMAANIKLVEQNKQLKELLRECKEVIKNVDTYYGNYDSTNGYLVINKIDEVLQ